MEAAKFLLFGNDKKTLSKIKSALVSNGYVFVGYSNDFHSILRHIRRCCPDFIIIEFSNNFKEIRYMLEVLDDELLAACILVFDTRSDEIMEFLRNSRVLTYLTKPVFDESVLQIVDLTLINFRRVVEYEKKVKKLNDTLESRKIIEKAKWILVEKEGHTESEAYALIKKKSRDNRITMKEIAQAIILAKG